VERGERVGRGQRRRGVWGCFCFVCFCAAERGDGRTVCGRKTTQCLPYSRCSTIILSFDLGWIATEDRNNILLGEKKKGVNGESWRGKKMRKLMRRRRDDNGDCRKRTKSRIRVARGLSGLWMNECAGREDALQSLEACDDDRMGRWRRDGDGDGGEMEMDGGGDGDGGGLARRLGFGAANRKSSANLREKALQNGGRSDLLIYCRQSARKARKARKAAIRHRTGQPRSPLAQSLLP